MKYEFQREKRANQNNEEPSLSEMTKVAIEILKKSENGYFLMVEGGKIDMAHHDGMVRHCYGKKIKLFKGWAQIKVNHMPMKYWDSSSQHFIFTICFY